MHGQEPDTTTAGHFGGWTAPVDEDEVTGLLRFRCMLRAWQIGDYKKEKHIFNHTELLVE